MMSHRALLAEYVSASIALEQSYGYIDGDSASLGEACTLISALSRTPLKQCFAITGSINQFGEVQAVGGVNEKIEGFFRLCEARGLTGEQGVIIPKANVATLMLDERVLQAVEAGRFHVYAVSQADARTVAQLHQLADVGTATPSTARRRRAGLNHDLPAIVASNQGRQLRDLDFVHRADVEDVEVLAVVKDT